MIIICEGPDFSGKTTLIQQLANDLNALVIRNRKPKNLEQVMGWVSLITSAKSDIICDRSALISEPIYGNIIRGSSVISERQGQAILNTLPETVVVYCDPGKEQVLKCNNEQMDGVRENLPRIYDAYAQVMSELRVPVLTYNFLQCGDYGDLLNCLDDGALTTPEPYDFETQQVEAFHNKYGVPMPEYPQLLAPDVLEFRRKFLQEELNEFLEDSQKGKLTKAFDALLDLTYVVKGTALLMGITPEQWAAGFDAVQKANMTKIRVTSAAESKRGSALDVRKPPGWVGPEETLEEILRDQLI